MLLEVTSLKEKIEAIKHVLGKTIHYGEEALESVGHTIKTYL